MHIIKVHRVSIKILESISDVAFWRSLILYRTLRVLFQLETIVEFFQSWSNFIVWIMSMKCSRYSIINRRRNEEFGSPGIYLQNIYSSYYQDRATCRGGLCRRSSIYIIHRRIARHETRMDTIQRALALVYRRCLWIIHQGPPRAKCTW